MLKKVLTCLLVLGLFLLSGSSSFAKDSVGYVNMEKVLSSYSKAKTLTKDFMVEQNELKSMIATAKTKFQAAKSEQEKQKLEEQFKQDFEKKNESIKKSFSKRIADLQSDIDNAIAEVAKSKGIDTVLTQDEVLKGGKNITDEVITVLNQN